MPRYNTCNFVETNNSNGKSFITEKTITLTIIAIDSILLWMLWGLERLWLVFLPLHCKGAWIFVAVMIDQLLLSNRMMGMVLLVSCHAYTNLSCNLGDVWQLSFEIKRRQMMIDDKQRISPQFLRSNWDSTASRMSSVLRSTSTVPGSRSRPTWWLIIYHPKTRRPKPAEQFYHTAEKCHSFHCRELQYLVVGQTYLLHTRYWYYVPGTGTYK